MWKQGHQSPSNLEQRLRITVHLLSDIIACIKREGGENQQWAQIVEIPVIAVMFCQAEEVYMFHTRHNPDYFRFTQLKYKEDYNKNVKGKWCETPYFDIATARVAMENLSEVTAYAAQAQLKLFDFFFLYVCPRLHGSPFYLQRKYTQHWEDTKDHIYFMQTDTPVYDTHKKARTAASEVSSHTRTHSRKRTITVATGIFIGPVSCGRHDRELTHVSEQSVSQRRESALTQGSCHFVPTQALRDREICLWFCLIAQTERVCRHFFVVTTCLSV